MDITLSSPIRDTGSFRDPSGHVFVCDERVLRTVNSAVLDGDLDSLEKTYTRRKEMFRDVEFADYNEAAFRSYIGQVARIVDEHRVTENGRVLVTFKRTV